MEIWTINFGKSPGDQVQSGQNVPFQDQAMGGV